MNCYLQLELFFIGVSGLRDIRVFWKQAKRWSLVLLPLVKVELHVKLSVQNLQHIKPIMFGTFSFRGNTKIIWWASKPRLLCACEMNEVGMRRLAKKEKTERKIRAAVYAIRDTTNACSELTTASFSSCFSSKTHAALASLIHKA